MKRMFAALLVFAVLATACGCGKKDEKNSTAEVEATVKKTETKKEPSDGIISVFSYKPDTFCPILSNNEANVQMLEMIFDSLITEDSYALETMMPFRVKEQVFVVTPHIGKALSYLQPKHRDILLLSYFAEWSDSKIARYLNLPVSTVNSRRNQALQQLKRIMEHDKDAETFTL